MRCYCHGTICGHDPLTDDDQRVIVNAAFFWDNPEMPPSVKVYEFGSFACIASWANDRSADHDHPKAS